MKKQPEHNRKNVPPQDTAKAPKSAVSRSMRTRAIVLAALFVLVGFGAVVYNLYQLQIVQHDELAARAENQQLADETITPNRGVIYDSDMKVLARSNKVWTVVASPRDMAKSGTNINDVAVKLAELLELDAQSILEKLQKSESNYQLIKRQIEKPVADAITAWITEYNASDKGKDTPVAGISLVQDAKRYYPYQTLASTIIGFVNADGDGVLGIESYYNDTLKGTAGRVVGMKNAWGYDLPNGTYEAAYDAEDGNGLVLTLNASIQSTLEKYLQNAVDQYHVENRAVGIVMDVNTGAILAMATMPDYNLQDPYTIADEALAAQIAAIADENERADAKYTAQWAQWRNKAVADLYYPGSVFKVITASAALDSGAANLNTSYTCKGSITVAGRTMRCAHTNHGTLDFFGGLDGSCNPYYVTLGQMMGAETFCNYMQAFGFYEKTGVDMDDEGTTQYVPLEKMGPVELASSAFGQTTSTTPIQMITAACAVINGGYLVQPHVVKQVLDADGNIIENVEPEVKRQVLSAETSATMRELLTRSVNMTAADGKTLTGGNKTGYVAGYKAGGKSGTSQRKQALKDEEQTYYSSYWGFAPGDDPQIAVLVMLDTPHDEQGTYYGGRLAAPVVQSVLDEALQTLGVPKEYTEAELAKVETAVPNVAGSSVNAAAGKLRESGFNMDIERATGDTVLYQYPAAGTIVPRQSTIILYSEDRSESGGDLVTVPNLTDMSYDAACATLKSLALNVSEKGVTGGASKTIVVTEQDIAADTQVEIGSVIEVTFTIPPFWINRPRQGGGPRGAARKGVHPWSYRYCSAACRIPARCRRARRCSSRRIPAGPARARCSCAPGMTTDGTTTRARRWRRAPCASSPSVRWALPGEVQASGRKAYAQLCQNFSAVPPKKLRLVAVTGTNGKTTVTTLIKQTLEQAGCKGAHWHHPHRDRRHGRARKIYHARAVGPERAVQPHGAGGLHVRGNGSQQPGAGPAAAVGPYL